jgi:hypothetical protein
VHSSSLLGKPKQVDNLEADGASGTARDGGPDDRPDGGESAKMPIYPAPPPIGEVVFDRLHSHLTLADDESEDAPTLHALRQLGVLMRRWRMRNNLTRGMVAAKVGMDESHLLLLEHGLALDTDVSMSQLLALAQWLQEAGDEPEFLAAIQHYLQLGEG